MNEKYILKGSKLYCLINLKRNWVLVEKGEGFVLSDNRKERVFRKDEVEGVSIYKGLVWSRGVIRLFDGPDISLFGCRAEKIEKAKETIEKIVVDFLSQHILASSYSFNKIENHLNSLMKGRLYIRNSLLMDKLRLIRGQLDGPGYKLSTIIRNPNFKKTNFYLKNTDFCKILMNLISSPRRFIDEWNSNSVKHQKLVHSEFFDIIESDKLSGEQRKAAVVFEDRNLLIAAAGSGKSSTLVGKVGYAIRTGMFLPEDIISLAFNQKAVSELKTRFKERVSKHIDGNEIKASTIHALGFFIVKKHFRNLQKRVSVVKTKEKRELFSKAVVECLKEPEFRKNLIQFLYLSKMPEVDPDSFDSLEEYEKHIEYMRQSRRNGQPAEFLSLSGDTVKSYEELTIANFLFLNGVSFKYERQFISVPDSWPSFSPDFYYPDIDTWHEHFALNSNGEAPKAFGDYARKATEKIKLFKAEVPDKWFQTRSANFKNGDLLELLKHELLARGQKFHELTLDELESRVGDLEASFPTDLVAQSISYLKKNEIDEATYNSLIKKSDNLVRAKAFSKILWPVYRLLNSLMNDKKKIDFDDMILMATKVLDQGFVDLPYKFILVDEFQDLSMDKAKFVNALLKQSPNSVLFGVGDDWQSINGFAGSDLGIFLNFEKWFGFSAQNELTKTFRNAQGIADVSSSFIQKNTKGQKIKIVNAQLDKTVKDVIDLIDYRKDEDVYRILDNEIMEITSDVNYSGKLDRKISIYLLSRYKLEKTIGLDDACLKRLQKKYSSRVNLEFLTIHKSKGLGADYVFLLGNHSRRFRGFPSSLKTDPLIGCLQTNSDSFAYSEERRLFYVAITRAKRKCFLLYERNNPSVFVTELLDSEYKAMVRPRDTSIVSRCRACEKGILRKKRNNYKANSLFIYCSRYKECGYKRTEDLILEGSTETL